MCGSATAVQQRRHHRGSVLAAATSQQVPDGRGQGTADVGEARLVQGVPILSLDAEDRSRPWAHLPSGIDRSVCRVRWRTLTARRWTACVHLPTHLDWSVGRAYDLADLVDRRRVYELVLLEGSLDDLRRYVDVRQLVSDALVLPDEIRTPWAGLLGGRAA